MRSNDLERVLNALEIDVEHIDRETEYYALCPGHKSRTGKADHKPSWSINVDNGVHNCYSCGFAGTLVTLVAFVKNLYTTHGVYDYEAAKGWLENLIEFSVEGVADQLNKARNNYLRMPKPVPMTEARLGLFDTPPRWALKARGVTQAGAEKYGVLWDNTSNSWILPIRHNTQDFPLMGWQQKGETKRLFLNRPPNMKKSRTIFGIEHIGTHDGLHGIVESPLDAVRLWSATKGEVLGLATCGAKISDPQMDIIRSLPSVLSAYDNPKIDPAGFKASKQLLEASQETGFDLSFFAYGETGAKDPGEMEDDEILDAVSGRVHSVFGRRALKA
jgi:DNA primase